LDFISSRHEGNQNLSGVATRLTNCVREPELVLVAGEDAFAVRAPSDVFTRVPSQLIGGKLLPIL
jgi:hypothetical protein